MAVELRRAAFDVGVPNAEVFDMPMELGLELVAVICPNFTDAKRELLDNVINEVDRACLRVFLINLESTNSGCVMNGSELKSALFLATFSFAGQKLNVHLDMIAGHLFLIALGV